MQDSAARKMACHWTRWAALAPIACFAITIRLPFLSWPLTIDEAAYAYTAQWWFRGLPLYSDQLWLDRPQGMMLAYQLGLVLLGGATWAIRLWGAVWSAVTCLGLYLAGRQLFDEGVGLAASVLLALFSSAPHIEGFTSNSELFMILPATFSAYLLLRRRPFLAGLLASIGLLLKPSGASAYLLAATWFAYERASWRVWLRFGLGALLPILASVAHGALTVGLHDYAYAVALFELGPGWGPHIDIVPVLLRGWRDSAPVWAPLLILGVPGLWKAGSRARVFMLLWLLSSLAGVALGGRWSPHYFTQLIPPLAACAGAGITLLWRSKRLLVRVEGVAIVAVFFLLFEGPFFFYQVTQGPKLLAQSTANQVSDAVVDYVRTHTQEDETICVAFAPSRICYQAGRRSVTPYLFWIHLFYHRGAYDRLIQSLEAREPAYVLVSDPSIEAMDPENRFVRALEKGYRVEVTFWGVPLYGRKP